MMGVCERSSSPSTVRPTSCGCRSGPIRSRARARCACASARRASTSPTCSAASGLYPDAPKPPCVVGYEIAGDVDALGDGVEGFEIGQRVMGGSRFGGYAQLAVAGTDALVPIPDGWSYTEAARCRWRTPPPTRG